MPAPALPSTAAPKPNATDDGRRYAILPVASVREGTVLIADPGFTCLNQGQRCTVQRDDGGDLFVPCRRGKHLLDGQLDDEEENYVGFYAA